LFGIPFNQKMFFDVFGPGPFAVFESPFGFLLRESSGSIFLDVSSFFLSSFFPLQFFSGVYLAVLHALGASPF